LRKKPETFEGTPKKKGKFRGGGRSGAKSRRGAPKKRELRTPSAVGNSKPSGKGFGIQQRKNMDKVIKGIKEKRMEPEQKGKKLKNVKKISL